MFVNLFAQPDWRNLVDIAILSVLIYNVIKLVMHTRANSLFKGIALILILAWISDVMEISALNWLLQQVISMGRSESPEPRSAPERTSIQTKSRKLGIINATM